jgi:hypothetical protein
MGFAYDIATGTYCPLSFYRLAFRLKLPGTPDVKKLLFFSLHQNWKPIAGIFPCPCVQICKSSAASEPTKYKACLGVAVYSKLIFSPF